MEYNALLSLVHVVVSLSSIESFSVILIVLLSSPFLEDSPRPKTISFI